MLKNILFGILAAIVVVAVGMSAYNATAGSAAQAEAQPVSPLAGNTAESVQQAIEPEVVSSANSVLPAEIQTVPQVSAQTGAQVAQTASQPAGQQVTGANQGYGGNGRRGNGAAGNGNGAGRWQGSNGNGTAGAYATPNPQNGFVEWSTFQGVVSSFSPPNFTLVSADGQTISAQLGNQGYVDSLGLTLVDGESVTVIGYWDNSGSLAVGQITLDASGQTFVLRDDLGRPLWGGGPNH
jgi:hypothetical protein